MYNAKHIVLELFSHLIYCENYSLSMYIDFKGCIVFHCVCTTQLKYLPMLRRIYFVSPFFAIINHALLNTFVHIS